MHENKIFFFKEEINSKLFDIFLDFLIFLEMFRRKLGILILDLYLYKYRA
jgi:hypothetical protein